MCAVHKKKQGLNVPDWVKEQWNKDQSGMAKMLMDANWDKDHAADAAPQLDPDAFSKIREMDARLAADKALPSDAVEIAGGQEQEAGPVTF
eukprot:s1052_g11.t1